MTEREAEKLIAVLMTVYPNHPVQPQTPATYALVMADVSYADAMAAALAWMRTSPHFPKPADLIGLLAEARVETPEWEVAWAEVERTIRTWGTYVHHAIHPAGPWPGWSSETLAAAVRHVGGYEAICNCDLDRLPTIRAQFRDWFKAAWEREIKAATVGPALAPGGNVRALTQGVAN